VRLFSSERTKSENRTLSRVDFNDKDSVVEFVTNRYHRRATHRQGMESQWFINIAQYLNFQHHHFDGLSRTLQVKPRPKGMVRLTCNKITPATMKFVSKFMRQKPIWTSLPATNDLEDQVKAILGTRLLRYYHRVEQLDRKLREFATWLRTTGNCFMRAAWDPDKSHEIMFEEEETQDLPPELMKIVGRQGQIYNLGDVDVRVRPPFCIDVDPSATSMEDAGWLIDSSAVPIERLRSRYGTAVSKIANDTKSGESLTAYYQKKIADMAGTGGLSGFGSDEEEEDDTVMVHELWVAPLPKTKGYHCVVAGGKILQLTKNLPSDFRVIPYGHVADIPVPGRFWGNSAIEYAIPLQASYNKGRSQMIQHRNLVLKPKILEPRGSRIGDAAFTDVAGERIQYTAPLRPDYMIGPELPETAHRILEYDLRDMEDALGVHEVTNSRAPSGVRAGVAITALQEQDDQTHAPVFMLAEKMLSDVGSWILQLIARNVKEERLVRIVGEEHQIDCFTFTGSDLLGQNKGRPGVNYFDVECQMGSQLPLSKAQRTQYVIDLVNSGILDRVADSKLIKKMLEIGSEEPGIKADQLDRQAARRENQLMLQGILPEPQPQDDDLIHLEELLLFMKSNQYLQGIQQDPELKMRAETHLVWTQERLNPDPTMAPPGEEEGAPPPEEGGAGSPEDLAMMLAQAG